MKTRKSICTLIVVAALLLTIGAAQAFAEGGIYEVYVDDTDEAASVSMVLKTDNGQLLSAYNYPDGFKPTIRVDGASYSMEKLCGYGDVALYTVEGFRSSEYFTAVSPRLGDELDILYYTDQEEDTVTKQVLATVGEIAESGDGYTLLSLSIAEDFEGFPEYALFSPLAFRGDNEIVGVAVETDGDYYLMLSWFDAARFGSSASTATVTETPADGGSSGGNVSLSNQTTTGTTSIVSVSTWNWKQILIVVLAAVAALSLILVVVLAFARKSGKKKRAATEKNDRPLDGMIPPPPDLEGNGDNGNAGHTVPIKEQPGNGEYCLACRGGFLDGRRFPMRGSVGIGRNPDIQGVLETIRYPEKYQGISRQHARVLMKNGAFYLVDTNSSYGTYLIKPGMPEPKRLTPNQPVPLQPGDSFFLGGSNVNEFRLTVQ